MKKDLVQQKSYFNATISDSYKQEMRRQKLKHNKFGKILEKSPCYQAWKLLLKSRRMAKCSSTKCEKDLKSGFLCFYVSRADSVVY